MNSPNWLFLWNAGDAIILQIKATLIKARKQEISYFQPT